MLPTARMGDLTIGNCGLGYLIPLSATVLVNGRPIAKIGDIAKAFAGPIGFIIQGSTTVFANGLQVARLGDKFVGAYTGIIIQGSTTVLCK